MHSYPSPLQLTIIIFFLFWGDLIFPHIELKSTEHFTIIFNTFVFFQLFNEINTRKVNAGETIRTPAELHEIDRVIA